MSDSTKYNIIIFCFVLGSIGVVYSYLEVSSGNMPWLIFTISVGLVIIFGPMYYYFKSKIKN